MPRITEKPHKGPIFVVFLQQVFTTVSLYAIMKLNVSNRRPRPGRFHPVRRLASSGRHVSGPPASVGASYRNTSARNLNVIRPSAPGRNVQLSDLYSLMSIAVYFSCWMKVFV